MSENKNVLNVDTKKSDLSPDDKHMLKSMFWRSWLLFSSFTMVKMQAFGFEFSMFPVINRFYKNNSNEKKQAIVRESSFFNCTYETAPFIMGLSAAMEKENANNPENFDPESINALKASLMGPLSGIGDSIFWGNIKINCCWYCYSAGYARKSFSAILVFSNLRDSINYYTMAIT